MPDPAAPHRTLHRRDAAAPPPEVSEPTGVIRFETDADAQTAAPEPARTSGPEAPQVQETAIEVFVPSSMTLSMNDLIEAYKEQSGAGRVVANYSDSALLGDRIRNNANCDIFICDDPAILDQLTEEKLADAESRAAFSGRELVTTKGEVTKESQSFYEFLLSEKAAEIMSASFDSGSAQ